PDALGAARYLRHRGWLRVLLARRLTCAPADVVVRRTTAGRPFVPGSNLRITAAHSRGIGLYATATEGALGVDLEWQEPDLRWPAILRAFGTSLECRAVTADAERRGVVAFYDWWCRKEAILKARGTGLSESLSAIPVLDGRQEMVNAGVHGAWSLRTLAARPGFSAALAWSSRSDWVPDDIVPVFPATAEIGIPTAQEPLDCRRL
ncbi:MAG TPA: 4'-phosphopantetheinyl transferase superfamily protein, partial [Nakamurella sp.]